MEHCGQRLHRCNLTDVMPAIKHVKIRGQKTLSGRGSGQAFDKSPTNACTSLCSMTAARRNFDPGFHARRFQKADNHMRPIVATVGMNSHLSPDSPQVRPSFLVLHFYASAGKTRPAHLKWRKHLLLSSSRSTELFALLRHSRQRRRDVSLDSLCHGLSRPPSWGGRLSPSRLGQARLAAWTKWPKESMLYNSHL